jgi:hypothetical protein
MLYVSADHCTLEWETLSLFNELGISLFSTGLFLDPKNPDYEHTQKGPLGFEADPALIQDFQKLNPNRQVHTKVVLSKSLVDKFDVVFVDHCCPYPLYIYDNWEVIKHKPIIWRTYAQQSSQVELMTQHYRKLGLKLIRFSPKERTIPNYAGDDAIIRSPMDPAEYSGWTGSSGTVLTFNNFFEQRLYVSNTYLYLQIRSLFPQIFHLYGTFNDNSIVSEGFLSDEEQKQKYREAAVYFALGSKPASLTYNFMEALLTGTPVVTWGPMLGSAQESQDWKNTYEVPDLFENGVHCMYSDDPKEIIEYIKLLLTDRSFSEKLSKNGRAKAIEIWDKEKIKTQWVDFFKSLRY